nr:MAG TPA: hypothetical protein [Caudoviricetes sp.]
MSIFATFVISRYIKFQFIWTFVSLLFKWYNPKIYRTVSGSRNTLEVLTDT